VTMVAASDDGGRWRAARYDPNGGMVHKSKSEWCWVLGRVVQTGLQSSQRYHEDKLRKYRFHFPKFMDSRTPD